MADPTPRNKPTHDICFVKERQGQKSYWTTIGAAWAHKDQMGLNLQLDLIPLDMRDGKIVVRVRTDKSANGEAAS